MCSKHPFSIWASSNLFSSFYTSSIVGKGFGFRKRLLRSMPIPSVLSAFPIRRIDLEEEETIIDPEIEKKKQQLLASMEAWREKNGGAIEISEIPFSFLKTLQSIVRQSSPGKTYEEETEN